jgi:serine/threonine protein phosphatase PrpC
MYVINVGDSRAVLACGDRTATQLSTDHKPEDPNEKARVERAGGQVLKYGPVYRVTSPEALAWEQAKIKQGPRPLQLAIARSFGDASLKAPRPLLISAPEIRRVSVKPDDKLVLLGCDGIWDVLSNQVAVDTALTAVDTGADARAVAGSVVNMAYQTGSTDNISVVAILLHSSAPNSTDAAAPTADDDQDDS